MEQLNFNLKNIKAIIGLGNPGKKYYKNRHNIGFRILDAIAQNYSVDFKSSSLMDEAKIPVMIENFSHPIILIKPKTFMNSSGQVLPYLNKKGIKSENILVMHDDLEKKIGNISLKFDGSARGHNGLKSIIGFIGKRFWRLRFGIDRPENKSEVADYVLSNFSEKEEFQISNLIDEAVNKIF